MPRGPRIELPGVLQHVTARAPKGLTLFDEPDDYRLYVSLLAAEVKERAWSLRTYALMPNHVHLNLVTAEADLGAGMKAIHERFVTTMHRTRSAHGHLFGDRPHSKPVVDTDHELACLRYIARNPVKAHLCASPADWPWSAHRVLAGLDPPPTFVDLAAVREVLPRETYVLFCETTDGQLLERLAPDGRDPRLASLVDDHRIPVEDIAEYLGLSVRTVHRRLADARGSRGTVP